MKVTNVIKKKITRLKILNLNLNPALAIDNYLFNFLVPEFVLYARV